MKKIWKVLEANPRLQKVLCSELGVSPIFAQLLVNRNIRTPEQAQMFLFGELRSCHDPFLLKGMAESVSRIKKAVAEKEKILIYGDYDVDGVTSTALLSYILDEMGADYDTFIPNRLEDGYGFNIRAVHLARERGIGLIITVDCGINSFKEVQCAGDYGIDVVITDHHEIKGDDVPPAFAIIDAHQPHCKYPYKHLAGVGVVYKLARALMEGREELADSHLDLVALGTIADIAPLDGENRILAKWGLKRLRETDKYGLKALMDVARISPEALASRHISFILGPRINAMGRVGSADVALDLFMCRDQAKARSIAEVLERENRNRQAIEKNLLSEVKRLTKEEIDIEESGVLVLAGDGWHPGVLGIVAAKISEEYGLPAILITMKDGKGKGSGRSVEGFNLFEALKETSSHLIDFGGHEAACGIKIRADEVDGFRKTLTSVARRHFAQGKAVSPAMEIDVNVPFSHIGVKLVKELQMLMPYGQQNAEPVFSTNGIQVKNNPRNIGRDGFKFLATCGNLTCEVITFRKRKVAKPPRGSIIDLAYTPHINRWEGIETIQLNVKDLQLVTRGDVLTFRP